MTWLENFYIGSQEYIIAYDNGTHYVIQICDYNEELSKKVFKGYYDDCKKYLKDRNASYLESLF